MPMTVEQLSGVAQTLRSQGLQGDDLVNALRSYRTTTDAAQASDGPPLIIKSLAVGGPQTVADQLSGVGLDDAAQAVRKYINPQWQQEVNQAAAGPLTDLSTWGANIGLGLPMVAEGALLHRVGIKMGATGTLATAALPGAAFVAQQRGQSLDTMKDFGIDPDIANNRATMSGLLNGALSEAEFAQKLIPFKVAPGLVSQQIASHPILARVAQELGINSLMGIEQGGMAGVTDYAVRAAIQDMKQRHGDSWEPPQQLAPPDYGRAVGLGVGVGMATRAATTVTMLPFIKYQERQDRIKANLTEGELLTKAMANGTMPDIPQPEYVGEVRTGQDAAALERQRLAAAPEVPLSQDRKNAAIDSASPENLLKLVNTLRSQLGDAPMPEDTDPLTLAAMAKGKYGSIPEGPSWSGVGDDRRVILKPILGGGIVPDQDLARGMVAGQIADNPIEAMKDLSPVLDAQLNVKSSALVAAGIDPEMARRPELIQPGMYLKNWMSFMSDKLTRGQYARATLDLDFTGDQLTLQVLGKSAVAHNDPLRYAVGVGQIPCPLPDGTDATVPQPNKLGTASMMAGAVGLRPFSPMLEKMSNDTKLPLASIDQSVTLARNTADQGNSIVQKVLGYATRNIPKSWGRGVQRGELLRAAFFDYMGPKAQEYFAKQEQYNLGDVAPQDRMKVLAARFLEAGRITDATPQDVIDEVQAMKPDIKILMDWLGKQAGIPFDRIVEDYLPLYHKYGELPEGDETSLGDFLMGHRNRDKARYRMEDVERATNLGDTARSQLVKGNTNMGQGTASYELHRAVDREFLTKLTTETDLVKLISIYAHRAINKRVFENMAPSIQGAVDFVNDSVQKAGKPGLTLAVRKITQDYLNSSLGIPETEMSVSRQLNLRSQSTFVGRLLDNHLNRMQKWFGTLHDFSGPLTLHDITQSVMGAIYPITLGIPFNMKAPLENILNQTPMAAAFGMSNFVHGMGDLFNYKSNAVRDELIGMNLHGMQHDEETNHIMSKSSVLDKVNQMVMHYFTWSDMEQRLVAGATARYAWGKLEPLLKADPTFQNVTMEQMGKVIWGGKTPSQLGMDLGQIAKEGPNLKVAEMFKGGAPHGFSGIENVLYSLVREGRSPLAREILIRYGADLAGFRYGRGGTPRLLGGVLKPLLMFASYPINYLEWQSLMLNPKNELLKNWASVAMVQTLGAALASTMGIATADRWLLTGPLPKEFGLQGPITQLLNSMLGSVTGIAGTATANVLPGVSDAEKKKQHTQMVKSLNDLGQRMYMLADAII